MFNLYINKNFKTSLKTKNYKQKCNYIQIFNDNQFDDVIKILRDEGAIYKKDYEYTMSSFNTVEPVINSWE